MRKCFLFILVVITFEVIFETHARPDNYQLSEKEENTLHEIGAQWKEVISWKSKPCNEFIDFVCTNKEHPKPTFKSAQDQVQDLLKEKAELVTETEEKYLKFASSCKNINQESKIEFIKWFKLDNSIGEWPAFEENWDDSKFNLPRAIGEMNSYNYPVVFRYFFRLRSNGSYDNQLEILKEYLDIDRKENIFKSAFKKLGVKNSEEVLADAFLFEKTFNEATESVKSFNDIKIKYSELSSDFPKLELDKQIETAYGEKFPDDYLIMMKSSEELQEIYAAISKLSPKVIANYFFCTVVFKTYETTPSKPYALFYPVIKASIIKHLYTENMKEIVKGMYITILEFLREYFKAECSSEQIIKFVTEDIFGSNEENLANEFKEVSTNDNDCMKNYNFLQRIQNRGLAKPIFSCKNSRLNVLKNEMSDYTLYLANLAGKPSTFIFESLIFSVMAGATDYYHDVKGFRFTSEQTECFSQQFTNKEVTLKDMNIILGVQFMVKVYSKWIKDYPEIVQQENKILQNYGLSAEKLHVLSLEKYFCEKETSFDATLTAIANSVDFPQIFDCPAGSKLNAAEKCTLW